MNQQRIFLLATGSFNPPTIMHLRIMELAKDYLNKLGFNVVGGALTPVHDGYGKKGLVPAHHRRKMVELALETSNWLGLSSWESAENSDWTRTRVVMDYHQTILNEIVKSNLRSSETHSTQWLRDISILQNTASDSPVQLKIVCGADYLESFNVKDLWKDEDTLKLVKDFGFVVISREGNNPLKSIYNNDILYSHQKNIHIVNEWIGNEISSTKIRKAIRRSESIKYLVPDPVVEYIRENKLYQDAP